MAPSYEASQTLRQKGQPGATGGGGKLALYTAMREQQLSKVGLAARMGLSEGAIRKLLNPEHRSHIRQVEKALRKVDKRLVVEVSRR